MSRVPLLWCVAIACAGALSSAGCDKKSASPAPGPAATPTADKDKTAAADKDKAPGPAPAAPVAAEPVAAPADPEAAAEHVISTGALDFDLVERGGKFILRDQAYELTFSHRPEVSEDMQPAPNGMKLKTLNAMATIGESDAYGMYLLLVPKNVPYDITKGMKESRDGAFRAMGAKLVSEKPIKIGGLDGRRALGKGHIQGMDIKIELDIAFDKTHRAMIGLMGLTANQDLSPDARAFLSSLVVKPGEGPPAGDGT